MNKHETNIQEKHSIYYNCSAEEVVKKHMRKTRVTGWTSIVILVVLLVYILFQKLTLATWGVLLIEVVLYLICRSLVYIRTIHLQNIFMLDCDPVKMYDVLVLLEQRVKKKPLHTLCLMKAQCCRSIEGRRAEGLEYLKQVKFKKTNLSNESIRLNEFANYSFLAKDRDSFERVKKDLEQLPEMIRKYNKEKEKTYHKCMEYVNAKTHLEYIIANGNTMSVVEEARKLLKEYAS